MNHICSALTHKIIHTNYFFALFCALISFMIGFCAFILPSLQPRTASATTIDTSQACSLTVESVYDKRPLSGMNISLYKVANSEKDGWSYTSSYSACSVSLERLEKASEWDEAAKKLQTWTTEHSVPSLANLTTETNGMAFFNNLEQGLYLVSGANITEEEKIYTQAPFLVALPSINESTGLTLYEVTAEPKIEQNSANQSASGVASNSDSGGENNTASSQKTGDYTFLILGGIAALVVVCVVVLVIAHRKK